MCSEDGLAAMDRRDFLRIGGTGLAGAVLLGGAGGALARTGSLREEFQEAAREYRVPVELLLAIGYVNTLWEMPPPSASDYEPGDLSGRGAYGIMQLVQNPWTDTLGRAASLTGLSEATAQDFEAGEHPRRNGTAGGHAGGGQAQEPGRLAEGGGRLRGRHTLR